MPIQTTIAGEILRAGIRFFIERGYLETRLFDIARCARVTEGALYRIFRDKQGLLEQTLRCRLIGSYDPTRPPHLLELRRANLDPQAIEAAIRKEIERIFSGDSAN